MTDEIDRAQQREAEWLGDALQEHARRAKRAGQYAGISARVCEDCGEPIPAARRQALPGVQRCVDCQELFERVMR